MNRDDPPMVSVMIPTYNQDRLIARAVESALQQDYASLEIIVSDDCSSDKTRDVVAQYRADKRLVYFQNERNLGRVLNYRTTLYGRVSGSWVLNLDGDDHFHSRDAISHMVLQIMKHREGNPVAVVGSYLAVHGENGNGQEPFSSYETGIFPGLEIFLNWDRLSFGHLSTLYRVDLARAIDYYRLDTISSDWESILRLVLHGDVIVTDKVIGVWNIHGNNATVTKSMAEGIRDYSYIEEAYAYALKRGIDQDILDRWFRRMVRFHTEVLWVSNARNREKLLRLVPYLLRTYPFAITALSSPKAAMKMALSAYPALFAKIRAVYRGIGAH